MRFDVPADRLLAWANVANVGTISNFGFRSSVIGGRREYSWAKGQTWYRNGTQLVLAVRNLFGMCWDERGEIEAVESGAAGTACRAPTGRR